MKPLDPCTAKLKGIAKSKAAALRVMTVSLIWKLFTGKRPRNPRMFIPMDGSKIIGKGNKNRVSAV